jgi:hypothetical protein
MTCGDLTRRQIVSGSFHGGIVLSQTENTDPTAHRRYLTNGIWPVPKHLGQQMYPAQLSASLHADIEIILAFRISKQLRVNFPRSGWIVGKNEAAGATDAELCHTEAVWAGKVRHYRLYVVKC